MAEGRMLKKEVSDSKKLGELKADRPRVLWFMMLPHLDRDGRLKADPAKIKGQICTMLGYSTASIQKCLEQLHEVGLVILYSVNGEQYLQYTRFSDFQSIKYDRESESKIPAPNPEDSGVLLRTPPKEKIREVKLNKENIREEKVKHLEFVYLTNEEHKKLLTRYGDKNTRKLIADLNRYLGQSGKKYKSHYYTLLGFARRDNTPELNPPPEHIAAEQENLEKKRNEMRQEYGQVYREKTTEELKKLVKTDSLFTHRWLIKEIMQDREKDFANVEIEQKV